MIKRFLVLLSVLIGTNDIAGYLDAGTVDAFDFQRWGQQYRALLYSARQANRKLNIELCTPWIWDGSILRLQPISGSMDRAGRSGRMADRLRRAIHIKYN